MSAHTFEPIRPSADPFRRWFLSLSRQAAAELASIFKSLENRNKKGLLNDTEKVRYAELCAEREKARRMGMGSREGECVIC